MSGIIRAEWRQPAMQGTRKSRVPTLGAYKVRKLYDLRQARGLSGTVPVELVASHVNQLYGWGFTDYAIAATAGIDQKTVRLIRHRRTSKVTAPYAARILSVTHAIVPAMAGMRIPNIGTSRRLHALSAIGWSQTELSKRLGVERSTLASYQTRPRVFYETWEAVKKLYEALSATPGPSAHARKTAMGRGYAPPIAWEGLDIDHPATQPDMGAAGDDSDIDEVKVERILRGDYRGPVTKAERAAVYGHAIENGWKPARLAEALHMKQESVERAILRRKADLRKQQDAA